LNHINTEKQCGNTNLNEIAVASQHQEETPATNESDPAPTKEKFGVPLDQTEYDVSVSGLIKGGLSLAEAQSVINQRRITFNQALREHKKESVKNSKVTTKTNIKRTKKNSKQATQENTQDGV
jgi:hypothetical protein